MGNAPTLLAVTNAVVLMDLKSLIRTRVAEVFLNFFQLIIVFSRPYLRVLG